MGRRPPTSPSGLAPVAAARVLALSHFGLVNSDDPRTTHCPTLCPISDSQWLLPCACSCGCTQASHDTAVSAGKQGRRRARPQISQSHSRKCPSPLSCRTAAGGTGGSPLLQVRGPSLLSMHAANCERKPRGMGTDLVPAARPGPEQQRPAQAPKGRTHVVSAVANEEQNGHILGNAKRSTHSLFTSFQRSRIVGPAYQLASGACPARRAGVGPVSPVS